MYSSVSINSNNIKLSKLQNSNTTKNIKTDGTTKTHKLLNEAFKSNDVFISKCTDGKDDGKLGTLEIINSFSRGLVNKIIDRVFGFTKFAIKHPIATIAGGIICSSLATAALTVFSTKLLIGGFAAFGLISGSIGLGKAVKGVIESYNEAKNAKTDAEAKQAIYNLGGHTFEVGENALIIYGSAKALKSLKANTSRKSSNYGNSDIEISGEEKPSKISQKDANADMKTNRKKKTTNNGINNIEANNETIKKATRKKAIATTQEEVTENFEDIARKSINNSFSSDEKEVFKQFEEMQSEVANQIITEKKQPFVIKTLIKKLSLETKSQTRKHFNEILKKLKKLKEIKRNKIIQTT